MEGRIVFKVLFIANVPSDKLQTRLTLIPSNLDFWNMLFFILGYLCGQK